MATRVPIGSLNRMISIEFKATPDSDPVFNSEVPVWERLTSGPIWASWEDALPSRSEAVMAGRLELARNQSRCRIRYRSDVTSEMRVILHGESDLVYQIVGGPAVLGRREFLEFVCEKVTS